MGRTMIRVLAAMPFLWRWSDFRPLLYRAKDLVDMDQAERRVLIFANPGLQGRPSAAATLLANLQIINPADIARSQRHTASALRLVVEGTGTNTAMNGGHQEVRETFVAGPTV